MFDLFHRITSCDSYLSFFLFACWFFLMSAAQREGWFYNSQHWWATTAAVLMVATAVARQLPLWLPLWLPLSGCHSGCHCCCQNGSSSRPFLTYMYICHHKAAHQSDCKSRPCASFRETVKHLERGKNQDDTMLGAFIKQREMVGTNNSHICSKKE